MNIIIYGPQGCGKTAHAEALRAFYGMRRVIDEETLFDGQSRQITGNLILANSRPTGLGEFGRAIAFEDAVKEAGITC